MHAGYIEKLISETVTIDKNSQFTITEDTPKPLCAAYEHPLKETAIQKHKSRFK